MRWVVAVLVKGKRKAGVLGDARAGMSQQLLCRLPWTAYAWTATGVMVSTEESRPP